MVVTGTDSYFRTPSSRRGEALWEREAAGSGSLGAASSESAAGSVRLSGELRLLSRPRIRSSSRPATRSGRAGVLVGVDGCEVRLCDPCACVRPCVPCVTRLPPVPRCLFTGTGTDSSTRSRGRTVRRSLILQAVRITACS